MKISAPGILIVLFVLFGIIGCSVKEERDACPCRLFLDLTSVDIMDCSPVQLYIMSEDGIEYEAEFNNDNFQDTCILVVPRKELDIVLWSGGDGYMDNNGLTIPLGEDSPPVYIHSRNLLAHGESVHDVVTLEKNYCILGVDFVDPDRVQGLALRGDVAGFDRYGRPVGGEFCVCSHVDSLSGLHNTFYVPRQVGNSLYLDVEEASGKVKTFPIHEYISEFGYDWKDRNLNDLNMLLEYTPVGVSITIRGWDQEIVFDVVI